MPNVRTGCDTSVALSVTARRLLPTLVLAIVASLVPTAAGEELSPTTGLAAFDHGDGRWFFHGWATPIRPHVLLR